MTTKQKLIKAFGAIVADALTQGVPVSVVCASLAIDDEAEDGGKPSPFGAAVRAFAEEYERQAPTMIGWRDK